MAWSIVSWASRIMAMFSAIGYAGSGLVLLYTYSQDQQIPVPGVNAMVANSLEVRELLVAGLFMLAGLMMFIGTVIWKSRLAGALMVLAWTLMLVLVILSVLSYGFVFFWFLLLGIPAAINGVMTLAGSTDAEKR